MSFSTLLSTSGWWTAGHSAVTSWWGPMLSPAWDVSSTPPQTRPQTTGPQQVKDYILLLERSRVVALFLFPAEKLVWWWVAWSVLSKESTYSALRWRLQAEMRQQFCQFKSWNAIQQNDQDMRRFFFFSHHSFFPDFILGKHIFSSQRGAY